VTTDYISSLDAQREPLPGPARAPSRLAELRALVAWIVSSWLRPADAAAAWQQRTGREARLP
jgi:hypothetical protein